MSRSLAVAVLSAMIVSGVALADDTNPNYSPPLERGFMADKVYQIGDVDHIDMSTRSLTLTIPIGGTFQVGGHLTYGLVLSYSMQGWDIEQDGQRSDGSEATKAEVSTLWNAGMGWRLSLGSFLDAGGPENHDLGDRYVGPDGSSHQFVGALHGHGYGWNSCGADGPVCYTRDGSYLRLQRIDATVDQRIVEFPDGAKQIFERNVDPGAPPNTWKLIRGEDAFGNFYTVTYDLTSTPNKWVINDSEGRTHHVETGVDGIVNKVKLNALGSCATGTQLFEFQYMWTSIARNRNDNRDNPHPSPRVNVNLLTKLILPDLSEYSMLDDSLGPAYHTETEWIHEYGSGQSATVVVWDLPGVIRRIKLPTGGRIGWETTEDYYNSDDNEIWVCHTPGDPPSDCGPESVGVNLRYAAVATRRIYDAAGTLTEEWGYSSTVPNWPGENVGCSHPFVHCHTPRERVVVVTDPAGNDTAYYFRAHPDSSGSRWATTASRRPSGFPIRPTLRPQH